MDNIIYQPTHIEGLDILLSKNNDDKKGFCINNKNPLSILLKGDAGSGKTTLSLQLAANIAKEDKRYCLYFFAEQKPSEIAYLFASFKWQESGPYILDDSLNVFYQYNFNKNFVDETNPIQWEDKKPGVYLYDMKNVNYDLEQIREKITSISEKFEQNPRFIIIDSLNLMTGTGQYNRKGKIVPSSPDDNGKEVNISEIITRPIIINLFNTFESKTPTPIFLFTLEKNDQLHINKFNFYFNMVIDLSEVYGEGYYFRHIQIEKARNQDHILGKHQYKIDTNDKGMKIIPSLHYILSRYKKSQVGSNHIISTGLEGMDKMLSEKEARSGVLRQSATIILGETGAKKTPLTLNFLAAGISDKKWMYDMENLIKKKRERVLYLSLREDASNVIRTIDSYGLYDEMIGIREKNSEGKEITKCHEIDIPCLKTNPKCRLRKVLEHDNEPRDSRNPLSDISLLKIKYFRPGFITPDEFMQKILQIIEQYKICNSCEQLPPNKDEQEALQNKIKFERVVLDDIAQFDLRFPLFVESPILLSTLIDVFKSNEITSMFIDVTEKNNVEINKKSFFEIVDNIFNVHHLSFYGKNKIGISVGRLHGGVYSSDYQEIRVDMVTHKIEIKPNFERFVKIESGAPVYPPLEVSVYEESFSHEEEFQENIDEKSNSHRFNDLIKTSLQSVLESAVKIKRITRNNDENYHFSIEKKKDIPITCTKVVTIDEYWVDRLIGNGEIEDKSCLLKLAEKRFVDDIFEPETTFEKKFWYKKVNDKIPHKRSEYVIPYMSNVQLLCYNADFIDQKNDHIQKWMNGTYDDYTWENLAKLLSLTDERLKRKSLVYYGGDEHSESLNCLFLDLLWTVKEGENLDLTTLSMDKVVNNIENFLKISTELKTKKYDELIPDSIFWLSWYSDLIRDMKKLEKQKAVDIIEKIRILPLPNRGISGEWFVGVLKGSVSPILGAEAVKYITSLEIDREKVAYGIGLPTSQIFYDGTNPKPLWKNGKPSINHLYGIVNRANARSRVMYKDKDYIQIKDNLALSFNELSTLQGDDITGENINKILKAMLARIDM